MNAQDFDQFADMLKLIAEQYGKPLSPGLAKLYFDGLSHLPLDVVRKALNLHLRDGNAGQFMPKIADVIRLASALYSDPAEHPGVEEAWALVGRSLNDEGATVVWTEQIAQAFGSALALADDTVAARMAFKERYTALRATALANNAPPKWTVSIGRDQFGREGPVMEAIEKGRLLPEIGLRYLPQPETVNPRIEALAERLTKRLEQKA